MLVKECILEKVDWQGYFYSTFLFLVIMSTNIVTLSEDVLQMFFRCSSFGSKIGTSLQLVSRVK